MRNKIKVYFILPTLLAGGAERVFLFISQHLNKDQFAAKLIVIGYEKDRKYNIDDVPIFFLNKKRVLSGIVPLARLLLREKPEIVVSTIAHLNVLMGYMSCGFRNIIFIGRVSAVSNPSTTHNTKSKKTKKAKISDFGITNLDYIICQSMDMKNDFLQLFDYDENRITIIHNPITQSPIRDYTEVSNRKIKRFFTIGRLSEIKGYPRIIKILSKLKFPFEYTIVGEGPLKEKIFEQAKKYGILRHLRHIPYTDNVGNIIMNHDMFLQGSYSEGFPNALLESCVLGTPVIAFDVPGGTKEIVENGINGFLVNNEEDFLEKLNDTREWDSKIISSSVYEKFNKEKILKDYEQLFIDILKK